MGAILEGKGAVHLPCWKQTSTFRWQRICLTCFEQKIDVHFLNAVVAIAGRRHALQCAPAEEAEPRPHAQQRRHRNQVRTSVGGRIEKSEKKSR